MTIVPLPLIAGNWKMNGTVEWASDLVSQLVKLISKEEYNFFEVLLCPSFPLLAATFSKIRGTPILLGGQDCHEKEEGPYTGDVSARMLKNLGCQYVIVGHSERRTKYLEKDILVQAKAEAAQRAALIPIICVGESLEEREEGRAEEVVMEQLLASIPEGSTAFNTVVAYEPLWAIGTGLTPTTNDIGQMHAKLREIAADRIANYESLRILYGGSVNPKNASEIMSLENVNGGLVGGASLKAVDFCSVVNACK